MNVDLLVRIAAELGDIRVVLAGTILSAGILCWRRNVDIALAFVAGIVLCVAATVALKLTGILLERASLSQAIGSPSGHVSLGTVFVGSIALILSRNRTPLSRTTILLCAALVVFAIAQSRVAKDAHTYFESLEGAVIGLASLAPLITSLKRRSPVPTTEPISAWPLVVGLALLMTAVFPMPDLDTESIVRRAADLLPVRHH